VKSRRGSTFRAYFAQLPDEAKQQARMAYRQFKNDPFYPGLHFKKVHAAESLWSVRVGLHYRAVGIMGGDTIYWVWIGSHAEYDKFLSQS